MEVPVYVSNPTKTVVTASTPQLQMLFPEAKQLKHPIKGEMLVINHGLAEYVMLRRLGYALPNPILSYYDWAGGRPFQVQRITVSMLTANARGYVLNDMGTGKTKTALWAWDALYEQGYCKKMLVVAPRSTLSFVWANEVFATVPHRRCAVLHGSKKKRLDRLATEADIYIINHDGLSVIQPQLEALVAAGDINVLVIDELAEHRNKNTRSKAMEKFAQKFDWVWGMTGSPMPHQPTDVWQQCRIVTPWRVPTNFRDVQDMLMKKVGPHLFAPRDGAIEQAFEWMQPSVRFSMDDVMELPDTVTREVMVPLGPKQQHVYNMLALHFQAGVENHVINAANAAVAMGKLLQVALGWVYTKGGDVVSLDNDDRLQNIYDLVMANSRKVIVFTAYRHAVDGIAAYLRSRDIDLAVVHGGVNKREEIFNAFQNSTKFKVLVAHPECMAHGVTLTAANMEIWAGPIADYSIYEQACARIRRTGQAHRQQIIHMLGSPVERKIYRLLRTRAITQDELLTLFETATSQAQEVA